MNRSILSTFQLVVQAAFLGIVLQPICEHLLHAQDPLPSWRESESKKAILKFVERVTATGTEDFVPPEHRIAVFDNDGTLWSEQPMYVQMAFVLDRAKLLAKDRPELLEKKSIRAIVDGDRSYLSQMTESELVELVVETHANMSTDEFEKIVKDWIATAKHPVYQRSYTECVYVPMVELLAYLRAKQFKTFIVSGGGIDFMRPWVESVYGIPSEQVIGSQGKLRYELRDSVPTIMRLPGIDFVDDKGGKPVGIQRHIGRRPILAFGNSDGDYEMLEYVTAGKGPTLGLLLHHTDGTREAAYDRESHFGRLSRGLDAATKKGWQIIDMQRDWGQVFRFQR
jgi:phosphoglycolate phosphatase-like HAD superfamily hydrolase